MSDPIDDYINKTQQQQALNDGVELLKDVGKGALKFLKGAIKIYGESQKSTYQCKYCGQIRMGNATSLPGCRGNPYGYGVHSWVKIG
jgi:hypothetical protein